VARRNWRHPKQLHDFSNNSGFGGGAYYGATLYNCTLSGNYASYGGGAEECTLVNCLLTVITLADTAAGLLWDAS